MSVPATDSGSRTTSDPTGLHRVLDDAVVLPQAAQRLDARRELWPDEVRVRVETLNLDAASFRQLYAVRCSRSSAPAARCRTP
jgi:L-erythro-3,5-diaminohexanoate dehydrogenase